jgi:hypothetical protein
MKFRISGVTASILAFAFVTVLAACGGGGGGAVPPPTNNPGPGPTGTPGPTSSPTASPAPTPTPTSSPNSTTVNAEEDWVNGSQSWYTGGTNSWASYSGPLATTTANGTASVDGTTCGNPSTPTSAGEPLPANEYSQHMFVGIYYNGNEEAVPQGIGLVGAQAPTTPYTSKDGTNHPNGDPNDNYPVELWQCEYQVHTHDYSGLVHIADTTLAQNDSYSYAPGYATLQTLFDLWGATLTSNGIAAGNSVLTGSTTIYTGMPSNEGQTSGADLVTSYTQTTAAPNAIPLYRHEAVWIVIGSPPSGGLPNVKMVMQY